MLHMFHICVFFGISHIISPVLETSLFKDSILELLSEDLKTNWGLYFSFSLLGMLRNKTKTVSQSKQLRVRLQLSLSSHKHEFICCVSAAYKERIPHAFYHSLYLLFYLFFCQMTVGWHDCVLKERRLKAVEEKWQALGSPMWVCLRMF